MWKHVEKRKWFAKRVKDFVNGIKNIFVMLALILSILIKLAWIYLSIRFSLFLWKRRNLRDFRRSLKVGGLREELIEDLFTLYKSKLEECTGLLSLSKAIRIVSKSSRWLPTTSVFYRQRKK